MLDERQVIELVRRVDPIEDLEDLPDPRLTAAEVLGIHSMDELVATGPKTHTTRQSSGLPILRGTAIAAASMAVVLLAVAVGLLVARSQSEEVASPVVYSSVPDFEWQSVPLEGGWFTSIELLEDSFIASFAPDDSAGQAQLLRSQDGLAWVPLAQQPGVVEGTDLFVHDDSLYAVYPGMPILERLDSVGGSWVRMPIEEMDRMALTFGTTIAGGDKGVVLIGQSAAAAPLLWVLNDGAFELAANTNLFDLPEAHPVDGSYAGHIAVTVLGDRFIAEFPPNRRDPVRLQSEDGIRWVPFDGPSDEMVGYEYGAPYVQLGERVFASGSSGVWMRDGDDAPWELVNSTPGSPLAGTPFGVAYSIGQGGMSLYLPENQGVAMSVDGSQWKDILEPTMAVWAIAGDEERLVVMGTALVDDGPPEDRIWVGTPTDATSPTTTSIEREASIPSFSWQASEPLSSWFMHLEAFDGGFVAVYDFVSPGILASQDGLEWAPLEDQPAAANHIAVHGGALYAGGNREWFDRLDSFGATWERLPMADPGVTFDIVHLASSQTGMVIYGEGRTGEHLLWRLEGDAFELVPIDTNSEIDIPTDMTALPPNGPTGLGEPFSIATITSIDSLSDGFVAAVSVHVEGTDTTRVLRFRSSDGIEWEPFEGPLAGRINLGEGLNLAGYGDAIIATAHYGSWLSEDNGTSWQTIDLEIGHPLVATPFGWVYAIGGVGPFSQTDRVELTIDGRVSTPVLADRNSVIAIAADDRRLVVADGNVIWVGEITE